MKYVEYLYRSSSKYDNQPKSIHFLTASSIVSYSRLDGNSLIETVVVGNRLSHTSLRFNYGAYAHRDGEAFFSRKSRLWPLETVNVVRDPAHVCLRVEDGTDLLDVRSRPRDDFGDHLLFETARTFFGMHLSCIDIDHSADMLSGGERSAYSYWVVALPIFGVDCVWGPVLRQRYGGRMAVSLTDEVAFVVLPAGHQWNAFDGGDKGKEESKSAKMGSHGCLYLS